MNPKKILITAALPYANGPLHFGHIAGAYLPADCYARFQRLKGSEVLYICGSDEHGVAITLSAEIAGRTPKEHVDFFHEINKNFFSWLNISFDHYSRTTWPGHVEVTQEFFKDLLNNGYIEEKVTDQLFSETDRKFLADRYVLGTCPKCGFTQARGDECQRCGASYEATDLISPRSKITGSLLSLKKTKHWFLRFDLFRNRLSNWIGAKDWKSNVINFAKTYIEDLRPRAITRDSDWGIPVPLPDAHGKVFYVWFDAPIGYISATKEWALNAGMPDAWKDFWFDDKTKLVQFIGKDNIPFHAVFFPAMCMGQNQPYKLVDELPANEFLNLEGRQFSKSEGWYIDLDAFRQHFSCDQIRYTIAANAPENQDADFSWKDFQMRCNTELLGKFGNLVNRVLVFARSHCDSKAPKRGILSIEDQVFLEKIQTLVNEAEGAFERFQLRRASQILMELAQTGNAYFDAKKPWAAAKKPELRESLENTISCCLECLKSLALIAAPIIPESAEKVWRLLGYDEPLYEQKWMKVATSTFPDGRILPEPKVLFSKIEDEMIEMEIEKLKNLREKVSSDHSLSESAMVKVDVNVPYQSLKPEIIIDDVRKLDLRVAQVLTVERIPKSKKLLHLIVDLGFEKRTIVSGIGDKIDDLSLLIGKKIVIVANLKPVKLMGIESQGMILAAEHGMEFQLPDLQNMQPGAMIS